MVWIWHGYGSDLTSNLGTSYAAGAAQEMTKKQKQKKLEEKQEPNKRLQGQRGLSQVKERAGCSREEDQRGATGGVAASLHHGHSNAGSEPHLRLTPQLLATPDP